MLHINLIQTKIPPKCLCGCDLFVSQYRQTKRSKNRIKGEWCLYIHGHNPRKENPVGIARYRTYKQRHKEKLKEKEKQVKFAVFSHYAKGNPQCSCCGESGFAFLTIDHIIPKTKLRQQQESVYPWTGKAFYGWLKANNYPDGFQVLCYNCNCAKQANPICPHQQTEEA